MKMFITTFLSLLILIFTGFTLDTSCATCTTPNNIQIEYEEEIKVSWRRNIGQKLYIVTYYTDEDENLRTKIVDTPEVTFSYMLTIGCIWFKIKAVCKNGNNTDYSQTQCLKIS